ncbi:p21-C-terminal region-binding protein-domain-containing protein [Lipomyces arxii]|uniref:p21-C-terminal region-binding protein-domain-containing protein n=1 Tax=Lipomyces arxii TaxID=56418 RepID=UPI0034CEA9FE
MSKRKEESSKKRDAEEQDSGSDNEDIVNVDFDFFDPRPDIDYHAIRNLLRQTFDADNVLFDLSALTDLILSQNTLGSTVKTDGIESDPFAYLTVINANIHRQNPALKDVLDYLITKTKLKPDFNEKLKALFADSAKTNTGIVFSERLINMPTEVVPPMYRMLSDEMKSAVENGDKYDFDYFVIISKSFTEIASKIDDDEDRPKKKKKGSSKETFYFHAEDEIIQHRSEYFATYKFSKESQSADSRRTFQDYGIAPQGQIMLVTRENFEQMIDDMLTMFAVPT